MNDAQIWTVIGGMGGVLAFIVAMTMRVVRAEITTATAQLGAQLGTQISTEVGALRSDVRALEQRFEHLDRDMQTVINRLMGGA